MGGWASFSFFCSGREGGRRLNIHAGPGGWAVDFSTGRPWASPGFWPFFFTRDKVTIFKLRLKVLSSLNIRSHLSAWVQHSPNFLFCWYFAVVCHESLSAPSDKPRRIQRKVKKDYDNHSLATRAHVCLISPFLVLATRGASLNRSGVECGIRKVEMRNGMCRKVLQSGTASGILKLYWEIFQTPDPPAFLRNFVWDSMRVLGYGFSQKGNPS